MIFIFQLILLLVIEIITFSHAAPPISLRKSDDVPITIESKNEDYNQPPTLSLNLEAPREEPAQVFYYDYPPPSEDLELPPTQPWNPNNDPKYYFELPAVFTKQATVTNLYPKKYSKDLHEKQKPFNTKPKQEIELIPISQEDYVEKQRTAQKLALNLASNQAKAKAQQTV